MSVLENLELGAFVRRSDRAGMRTDQDRVLTLSPRLAERRTQLAGTLSGGDQQMLGDGARPLEPAETGMHGQAIDGLAQLIEQVFDVIQEINHQGTRSSRCLIFDQAPQADVPWGGSEGAACC